MVSLAGMRLKLTFLDSTPAGAGTSSPLLVSMTRQTEVLAKGCFLHRGAQVFPLPTFTDTSEVNHEEFPASFDYHNMRFHCPGRLHRWTRQQSTVGPCRRASFVSQEDDARVSLRAGVEGLSQGACRKTTEATAKGGGGLFFSPTSSAVEKCRACEQQQGQE